MRMVYTNENRFLVGNAKNILAHNGIDVVLKNEYAAGGVGELSAFDSWLEIWVLDDNDYDRACNTIENSLSDDDSIDWRCLGCEENNDASFDSCWKCQSERPSHASG